MWREKSRFMLGCSTPKRRAVSSKTGRNFFFTPITSSSQADAPTGIQHNNGEFDESLPLPSTQLEKQSSLRPVDSSFVSARQALETDLENVDWASPISTRKAPTKRKDSIQSCTEFNTLDNIHHGNRTQNEIKDLSDDMFKSKLEVSCTNNHESTQFCKTAQYRREVDSLFNEVETSICGFDKSLAREPDAQLLDIFENEDSFMVNIEKCDVPKEPSSRNPQKDKQFFYGLPPIAKSFFVTYKNVDMLYDWQDECLNLQAIEDRRNLIYALPTSGGKTLVAEILMLKEVVVRQKNVIFILPFVALVQEKVWGLSPFAVQMNFLIEEYAAGKGNFPPQRRRKKNCIYIATLEKGLGLVRNLIELRRLNEIGLIVVDELHLVGEPSRGSTLEMMLASIMYTSNNIQIIGMSATIGNVDELAKFLNAEVYSNQFRPVELKEYVKVGGTISSITWTESGLDIKANRQINFRYSSQVEKLDPDHLGGLVMEVVPKGSCLIFCPTKKNCENVAVLLCKVIFRQLLEHKAEEKQALLSALKSETGNLCNILAGAIPWGVAYHHSGLTAEERRLLEDSFRCGVISVLCCTSTLAAGVNLPASRVILRSPFVGRDFITLSTYKQMVGRAGRAGFGNVGESIVICSTDRYSQLCDLLNQPMDKATSGMHGHDGVPLRGFVLSAIGLGMATNREQILKLLESTLMGVQAERLGLSLKKLTNDTLKQLITCGAVEVDQPTSSSRLSHSSEANDSGGNNKIVVYTNSTFRVSKLGKAAIRGCMDLTIAQQLYNDMQVAQQDLVVMGVLHLLYLVTPYEYTEIQPDMAAYYEIYSNLNSEGLQTAKVLGITESNAVRMVTGKPIRNVPERVLSRFYVTLMLHDLWCQMPVAEVAEKYRVSRGTVQTMMVSTASFASNVLRFCEELEEFWAFKDLLVNFTKRISHCCAPELLPLMDLPSVKKARAMQLYKAGYKKIEDVARANPSQLVESIQHLSTKVAVQLISSAKMLLIEKVENLREEAEDVMDGLGAMMLQ